MLLIQQVLCLLRVCCPRDFSLLFRYSALVRAVWRNRKYGTLCKITTAVHAEESVQRETVSFLFFFFFFFFWLVRLRGLNCSI
jgi:hypothetical protein